MRPHLEYAPAAWNTFGSRTAHKFTGSCTTICYKICLLRLIKIFQCYHHAQSLGWDTLEVRRHLDATTVIYSTVHNLAHLTFPSSVNLAYSGHTSSSYTGRNVKLKRCGNAWKRCGNITANTCRCGNSETGPLFCMFPSDFLWRKCTFPLAYFRDSTHLRKHEVTLRKWVFLYVSANVIEP